MNEDFIKLMDEYKKKTEKECYKFNLVADEPSILDDKIGGKPYLPVGEAYPVDKSGNPMGLVLQLNLKNIDLEDWPKKGILEIFVDASFDYPCQYEIRYFEEGLEYQTNLPDVDYEMFIVGSPIKIELEKTICHMPLGDYRFEPTLFGIAKELFDKDFDSLEALADFFNSDDIYEDISKSISNPYGTIGGYADFTQTDPRYYDKETERDDCLLKLDSCLDMNQLYIGDSGILFVLISHKDIANKNFKAALVDWDCC